MKTKKIKVEGKVQGVFFRQSAKETAGKLGIKGTVKNCEDDSVEIVATGDEEELRKLIEWCRQGPQNATVTNVLVEEVSLQQFRNFSILYF